MLHNIIDRIPLWKLSMENEKQKKVLGYRKQKKQHKKESNSSSLSRKEKKNLAKSAKSLDSAKCFQESQYLLKIQSV